MMLMLIVADDDVQIIAAVMMVDMDVADSR